MESSDNLASTHKTFTYHGQYYSVVYISFLWDGGGGVKILWYNILTPPPHLVKFDETILEYWLCVVMINQP